MSAGGPTNMTNGGSSSSPVAPGGSAVDEHVFNRYHLSAFMAMEVLITVVPRFALDRVEGIGGSYGPFAPNYPIEVPLWLALYLCQTDTCTLVPPDYLRVEWLRDVAERERTNDQGFEPLPFYFYEVAKQLTERGSGGAGSGGGGGVGGSGGSNSGGGSLPHVVEVVRYIHDIQATRQQKLKNLMTVFEAEGSPMFIPGVLLTNIVCHELHFLRSSFAVVLQQAATMEQRRLEILQLATISSTPARPSTGLLSSLGVTSTPSAGHRDSRGEEALASQLSSSYTATTTTGRTTEVTTAEGEIERSVVPPDSLLHVSEADTTSLGETRSITTDTVPLPQPALKKRRTLRQT